MTQTLQEFPKYMNKGSRGPHVKVLKRFLEISGFGANIDTTSEEYDQATADRVCELQERFDIGSDGNFGPITRGTILNGFEFNFEAECSMISGRTMFLQPDGSEIWWSPPKGTDEQ